MKDTQTDTTSLKQTFTQWSTAHSHLFTVNGNMKTDDVEPFHKAPAPSAFHTSDILSRFTPDPLLTVTPEKSLGQAFLAHRNSRKETSSHDGGDGNKKTRPRVHFAPDTRTSPPSKAQDTNSEKGRRCAGSTGDSFDSMQLGNSEESVPRSFSTVNQKLYQPGRYTDDTHDSISKHSSSRATASVSETHAPKRFTVESHGKSTVHVPLDQSVKNITSEYSDLHCDKPITAKVLRHKPGKFHSTQAKTAENTELKEIVRPSSYSETQSQNPSSSRSVSPSNSQRQSSRPPRKVSPLRRQSSPSPRPDRRHTSSPSRTSGRLTPEEISILTVDDNADVSVKVIREAPHEYKLNSYVFPFKDREQKTASYDSEVESCLARPEFNSALKISAELQNVKDRKTDTWGAVSEKLKTSHRKRSHIQEKASSKVNIQMHSGIFSDLVDVDVPLDDLCQDMERGITLRAQTPRDHAPVKVPVGREPDLMEFFFPDLQQESPDLTLTGIPPIRDSLTTANHMLAFDLYRHNRAWNGLTDS